MPRSPREALELAGRRTSVAMELERIRLVQREAWKGWKRSQLPSVVTRRSRRGDRTVEVTVTKTRVGNPRFLNVLLKCVDRRIRLLGLDARLKFAEPVNRSHNLTLDERRVEVFVTIDVLADGDETPDAAIASGVPASGAARGVIGPGSIPTP